MAKEIPPLACLHVALIKPFLYSRKSCFPVCRDRAMGMTRKEGRRMRVNESERAGRGRKGKRQNVFKAWVLFMDISLKLASGDLALLFRMCLYIQKGVRAHLCLDFLLYYVISMCARWCTPAGLCGCVRMSAWVCVHFWQISGRITVVSYFHF